MRATELRIGNWLYDTEVVHKGEFQAKAGDIVHIATEDTSYRAVPLTEEWLTKFGFYINGGNTSEIHFQIVPDDLREFNIIHINEPSQFFFSDVEIQFVHQLQNLFFALTGDELIFQRTNKNNSK